MNEFLRYRAQVDRATKILKDSNYHTHPISCKDWELLKATEQLFNGDLLDMGADGSFVLHNAILKGRTGRKVGIDLAEVTGDNKAEGAEYVLGNLMETPFMDGSFDMITSLSTIEHEVDFKKFAKETSRLLRKFGHLIVSFDYCNPKVNTDHITLYNLKWNILDYADVNHLVDACEENGMTLTHPIDWTLGELVINPKYCSPGNVSYTFGILQFIKQ